MLNVRCELSVQGGVGVVACGAWIVVVQFWYLGERSCVASGVGLVWFGGRVGQVAPSLDG